MTESDHKSRITALFDTVAGGYDSPALRFFPFCADRLVSYLQPLPGQRLLDVATGTGAAAIGLAQAVGPAGRVHAIDLSEAMLARAEANVRKMALGNVDFHVMDAEQLEFRKDYFHGLVCSFGLFFLPDMDAAMASWVRVLRPGGRLVFSTFSARAFEPMKGLFLQQLAEFGGVLPGEGDSLPMARLQSGEQCDAVMAAAGLEGRAVETLQLGYHLRSAEDWWEVVWNSGYRGLLNTLPGDRQADFQQAHMQAVGELATDDGIWMDVEVLVASGAKPEAEG